MSPTSPSSSLPPLPFDDQDLIRRIAQRAADALDPPEGRWTPLPHQIPPRTAPGGEPWDVWLLAGGRGTGKTDGAARWFDAHANGPPCDPRIPGGHRMAIIAPTQGDAAESCVNGPSGLKAHNPTVRMVARPGGTYAIWPNGVEARLFGAHTPDDVERLRAGGNRCAVWCEELAAWRQLEQCWSHMEFGLRVGAHPRIVASTTPKPKRLVRVLFHRGGNKKAKVKPDELRLVSKKVALTHGTTRDNPHLAKTFQDSLSNAYSGTRLGQQEIEGELLDNIEGALWRIDQLEDLRLPARLAASGPNVEPQVLQFLHKRRKYDKIEDILVDSVRPIIFDQVVVAIDPAVTANEDTSDETAILVCARARTLTPTSPTSHRQDLRWWENPNPQNPGPCFFVLDDRSGIYSPNEWRDQAIQAYNDWEADYIVGEVNNGGDLVEANLRSGIEHNRMYEPPPFKQVRASRGKLSRAEPVAGLFEQKRAYLLGYFPTLEDQMTSWTPESNWSPDRLDGMVWGISCLMGSSSRKPAPIVGGGGVNQRNPWKM